jgi:5,10-methylenetetrahydromethanopterin reductase
MQNLSFSVALYGTENARRSIEFAKLADDFGYEKIWVGDSHMIWREVYALLGAMAVATKKIQIGPGVTHPEIRHFTVIASAMATLNELSEGRAVLGVGVGATGPGNIGLKPVSVERLEEVLILLKKLLDGESVELEGKAVRCVFAGGGRIPIFIGTRAPKVFQMAARWADGIIYTGERESMEPLVNFVREYSAKIGRDAHEVKIVYRLPCSISDDPGEAREIVKGKIARTAMTYLGRLHRRGELHDAEDQKAVERLWREYDTYHHMGPEHSHLVRDEWVDRFALAGTGEQVREKVKTILGEGVDEITIIPFGDEAKVIDRFAKDVMERI